MGEKDQNGTEKWRDLCRQAESEKDFKKLMGLIMQIEKELEKQDAQKAPSPKSTPPAG